MPDDKQDDDFGKELAAAFAADEGVTENPVAPAADDANKPNPEPATPPAPAKVEEPKPDEPKNPEDQDKKPEEPETPPATPETPPVEDQPKPLTEEGILRIINQARALS